MKLRKFLISSTLVFAPFLSSERLWTGENNARELLAYLRRQWHKVKFGHIIIIIIIMHDARNFYDQQSGAATSRKKLFRSNFDSPLSRSDAVTDSLLLVSSALALFSASAWRSFRLQNMHSPCAGIASFGGCSSRCIHSRSAEISAITHFNVISQRKDVRWQERKGTKMPSDGKVFLIIRSSFNWQRDSSLQLTNPMIMFETKLG